MGTSPSKQHRSKSPRGKKRARPHGIPSYPLSCKEWTLVCSQTTEKWKVDKTSKFFSSFIFCNYKSEKSDCQPTWNSTSHTFELEKKKELSSLQCRSHDQLVTSVKYDVIPTLGELLSVGKIDKAMASAEGYVSLLFSVDTLADSKVYCVFICGEDPSLSINFSVDRTTEFSMEQCVLSPDHTRACLLLTDRRTSPSSSSYVIPTQADESRHFDIQIYSRRPAAFDESFSGNMFEMEYQISGLQAYNDSPFLQFDPRYYSSRMWMVNVKSFQFNEFNGYLKGYNIDNKQIKVPPAEGPSSSSVNGLVKLLDCLHSPDGAFVVTLVYFRGPDLPASIEAGQALQIYDSDSLMQLKIVTLDSSPTECFANFLPVFSRCSRKIALRTKKHIKVYQLPRARSLQALSRSVVLHYHGDLDLERLCVAQKTKDYLQFKPYLQ